MKDFGVAKEGTGEFSKKEFSGTVDRSLSRVSRRFTPDNHDDICYLSIKNPFLCRYSEVVIVSTPICSHSKGSFLNSLPSFCNLVSSVIT